MIDTKALEKANAMIEKIDFKGKGYALVSSRVAAFRAICPGGSITCEVINSTDPCGSIICKATICDEDGRILATGLAHEKEGSSYINKTSYVENCETSAVGRALGFLGIGSDESMASAEELANALINQGEAKMKESLVKKITKADADKMTNILSDAQKEWVLKTYHVAKLTDLTNEQYGLIMRTINERLSKDEG